MLLWLSEAARSPLHLPAVSPSARLPSASGLLSDGYEVAAAPSCPLIHVPGRNKEEEGGQRLPPNKALPFNSGKNISLSVSHLLIGQS